MSFNIDYFTDTDTIDEARLSVNTLRTDYIYNKISTDKSTRPSNVCVLRSNVLSHKLHKSVTSSIFRLFVQQLFVRPTTQILSQFHITGDGDGNPPVTLP